MYAFGVDTREGLNKHLSFRTLGISLVGGTNQILVSKNDIQIPTTKDNSGYYLKLDY